ncbi:hypothetical protein FJT64_007654 [Amphibalanus amphitrite]|uniref:Protein takeout n=1 Tax=Amphibalanus amphitrite TaxID=1232801 RepID=A0A6A4VV91_AMPAM|nr:hypothetical protein FJT64_007654 [Amphibalanus amphitrite]
MGRGLLPAGLLLLAIVTSAAGITCNFRDAASLTSCVGSILSASRPALKKRFDPLRFRGVSGTGAINWTLTGVQFHGLSQFQVIVLEVQHSANLSLTVQAALGWQRLAGSGAGWFSTCPRVLGKPQCFSFTARPRLRVEGAVASLATELYLSLRNGTLKVTPRNTQVGFDIEKLNVNVNLDGFLGVLDNMLRNPSDKYAEKLTKEWWTKNKPILENKAKKFLNQLVKKHLSQDLATLLKGVR